MLYGNANSNKDVELSTGSDSQAVQSSTIPKKSNTDALKVTSISDIELQSITPLLKSTYYKKNKLVSHPYYSPNSGSNILQEKPSKGDLVSLMRKEVDFRRQVDNLNVKLRSRTTTRKSAVQLCAKIANLQQRLHSILSEARKIRDSPEMREETRLLYDKLNQPITSLIDQAVQASKKPTGFSSDSIEESGDDAFISGSKSTDSDESDSIESMYYDDDEEEEDTTTDTSSSNSEGDDENIVIRGTDVIRRLLAEVRGNRRHAEETWERIIHAAGAA